MTKGNVIFIELDFSLEKDLIFRENLFLGQQLHIKLEIETENICFLRDISRTVPSLLYYCFDIKINYLHIVLKSVVDIHNLRN
jgi:hypothetical protein